MPDACAPDFNRMTWEETAPDTRRRVTTIESPVATGTRRNESRAAMLAGVVNGLAYGRFVPVKCVALTKVTASEPALTTATIWPAVVSFSNASLQAPASATNTATATACRLTSPIPVSVSDVHHSPE